MAIAYLLGKGSSKALRTKLNIPILLVLSILPDIDILYDYATNSMIHRGPTHSVIIAFFAFIPIIILYRKKAVPYFLALISHPLIGDYFVGGKVQLLWPFSTKEFGFGYINSIFDPRNILLEVILFIVATLILYKSKDWKVFFSDDKTNLVLLIPIATVLLPSTIGYPFSQSLLFSEPALGLAHLFYLALFSVAVAKALFSIFRKPPRNSSKVTEDSGQSENQKNAAGEGG